MISARPSSGNDSFGWRAIEGVGVVQKLSNTIWPHIMQQQCGDPRCQIAANNGSTAITISDRAGLQSKVL